jgi:hypothetical protein
LLGCGNRNETPGWCRGGATLEKVRLTFTGLGETTGWPDAATAPASKSRQLQCFITQITLSSLADVKSFTPISHSVFLPSLFV